MRVKLTLHARDRHPRLPLNSSHAVAALIYHTIGQASAGFASMLHQEGFNVDGRSFTLHLLAPAPAPQ